MTALIRHITSFFTPDVIQHPFKSKTTFVVADPVDDKSLTSVKWGANKVVSAEQVTGEDFISWTLPEDKSKKNLSPVTLDAFDMSVIRKKNVSIDKYKLVKPYVIADWTNKDIASVLKMSVSWCEKLTPRIKEAAILRNQNR